MIATGIFLFLLGTKLGRASDIQSNFVYEPSKIIVREEIDQSSFLIPELGPSPFLPNAVNQKSNYLLDKPFSMPGDVPAPKPVKIVTKIIEEERKNVTLRFNSNITNILIRERVPAYQNPVIDENEYTASQHSRLSLPIPDIALNVKPIPYLPSLSIPIVNSQLNIVYERILPNVVYENSKMIGFKSTPATKRVPIVTKYFFSFVKK